MADEPIGSVSVNITGDYGELGKDFDAAVALAVEKGATLADAINQALAAIDPSQTTAALGAVGEAAQTAGEQASAGMEAIGTAATPATEAVTGLGEAAAHAKDGAHDLLETLLQFTGVEITLEAIKEAITEMVTVFSTVEKASISLTALSGSAEEAEATIDRLKNQAMATATPFLELVQAQQKLTAAFVDNEAAYTQIPGVLHAASEAAAATGGSFATAANAIERIGLSGMVSGRMLVSLGLSADELAAKIGVATEDIAKAFKQMDPSERIQYIVEALGKFEGTAEAVASGVAGQMQRLKTEWEFLLEDMGKALAPLASQWIRFVDDVIKNLDMLAVDLQKAVPIFKDWQEAGVTAVDLVATAINVRLGGALAVLELLNSSLSLSRTMADAAKAGQDADNAFARLVTTVNQLIPATGQFRDTFRQLNAEYKASGDQAAYERGLLSLMQAFHESTGFVAAATEEHKKFNLAAKEEDDHFNMLVKDGLLLKATFEQIMSPLQNDAQYLARFNAALQEHTTILPKAGESMAEYRERIKSLGDNDLPVLTAGVADLTKELKAADAPMKALDLDLRGLDESGRQNIKDWTEFEAALRTLGLSGRKDLENVENAAAKVFDAFQHGYATLNQAQQAYIREVNAEVAAGQHLSTQTQAQYAAIKFSIQAAEAEAHLFENVMNTVSQDITAGLMGVITHTESVGQAFQKLGLDILQIIIDTVIKQAISALITALVGIPVFAATSAIAQIQDAAAVAFANAYAANVGIPFVGPAVAAAAGAEAYTTVIGAESLLHFDNGGWVPEDMVAVVHKGEFVNPVGGPYAPIGSTTNNGGNVHIGSINLQGHPREMAKELAKLLKISSSAFTS